MATQHKAYTAINGAKIRAVEKADGNMIILEDCSFYSRTFFPTNRKFIEAQDEAELFTKVKASTTAKFKEADLSKEMLAKFSAANVSLEPIVIDPIKPVVDPEIKPIDVKPTTKRI